MKFVLAILTILLFAHAALALTIATDNLTYRPSELVKIFGTAPAGAWIALQVNDPAGNPLVVDAVGANATGNWSYSFMLPSDAAVGTYNVTAVRDEEVNRTTFLVAASDFNITLSPNSASVQRGNSTTITANVTRILGYNQIVNLTALNKPANVTVTFTPASGVPPFSSNATIAVGSTAVTGTYTLIINSHSIDREHNATFNLTVPAICGNGIIEPGESCDGTNLGGQTCAGLGMGYAGGTLACAANCAFNTAGCTWPISVGSGTSTGGLQTIVIANIGLDHANLSVTNLPANASVSWFNPNTTAFKIATVNLTTKIAFSRADVRTRKISLPTGVTPLSIAYQYFDFNATVGNVSLPETNISSLKIKFAVENSWIANNNIDDNTIALYRWTGSNWSKLTTTWLIKDITYTYYGARSPGFSYFGVAGAAMVCPSCPEPAAWSTCTASADGKGVRSRKEYECDAATNYQCISKIVTQSCCFPCNQSGAWSVCTSGQQARTEWRCDPETDYACRSYQATQPCVDAGTANNAISRAQSAIGTAKSAGKNVASAELMLVQAREAFSAGDYTSAQNLATQAESAAEIAIPSPTTFPLFEIIIGVAAVAAVLLVAFMLKRGRAPAAKVCIVCGQPTTMRTRCSNCMQYACVRHLQMISGKPYCTNCVKKMYG